MRTHSLNLPHLPRVVTVCGWCPDKPERDAEARRHGYRVSHIICPTCREKLLAEGNLSELLPGLLNPQPRTT